MFNKFPYNGLFSFNLEGQCLYDDKPLFPDSEGFYLIVIEGKEYRLHGQWLGLISHYQMNHDFEQTLKNVIFVDCSSRVIKLKCKKLMTFRKPMKVGDGSFVIPGFTDYSITSKGEVFSLRYGRRLKTHNSPYPCVSIYDQDKKRFRDVGIHILLSRVFLDNPDPGVFCYVNHKDGNKLNFDLKNLEWVTSRQNNQHAVDSGLRNDNKPCKVRNVFTGEITVFSSVTSALNFVGLNSQGQKHGSIENRTKPLLLKRTYELKLLSDESEWYYTSEERLKEFCLKKGPYQAINRETNEVIESPSIIELANKINLSHNQTLYLFRSGERVCNNGYSVRSKSDLAWLSVSSELKYFKPRKFKITNTLSGISHEFNSLRKVIAFLGIDKRTLNKRLKEKSPYKEWVISTLE